jgi:DNA topoisomerase-6 subunit A
MSEKKDDIRSFEDVLKQTDDAVLRALREWAEKIVNAAAKEKKVYMEVPVRTLSNVHYDEESRVIKMGDRVAKREFLNVGHAKRFIQTALVAATIKDIVSEGITTSLRDVYYRIKHTIPGTHENTVDEQKESDKVIEDLETMLGFVREQMHIFSKGGKGQLAGPIQIEEIVPNPDGGVRTVEVDGENVGMGGLSIPPIAEPERVRIKRVDAEFVLVIEKSAVWTRFHEDRFWDKHNCIIITAGGQPDRATRRIVHRLHYDHKLPVYVMTDADPWGWYIYSVYKQGSINLSYLSTTLATPDARFLGFTISDYHDFGFAKDVKIKLTEQDKKRLNDLRKYPWFKHKAWHKEFDLMEKENFKMELEAASSKYFRFITKEYTPKKIEAKAFLP